MTGEKRLLLDSASFTEVLLYLQGSKHPWAEEVATEFTTQCIFCDHARAAPGMGKDAAVSNDDYGHLAKKFGAGFRRLRIDGDTRAQFQLNTGKWLEDLGARNKILQHVSKLANSQHAQLWLSAHRDTIFPGMSERAGAIFHEDLVHAIAETLGEAERDVREIQRLSTRPEKVRELSRKNSEASGLLERAFLAAFLIRGKYHDEIAENESFDICHHPLRRIFIDSLEENAPKKTFGDDKLRVEVESAIGSMILKSAAMSRGRRKLDVYVHNLHLAKNRVLADDFEFPDFSDFSEKDGRQFFEGVLREAEIEVPREGLADLVEGVLGAIPQLHVPVVIHETWKHLTRLGVVPRDYSPVRDRSLRHLAKTWAGRVNWPKTEEKILNLIEL
jgi:hypothetical protein